MIKLERTSVFNFENAIRGARNPMNSWDKSDSKICRHDEQLYCEGSHSCKHANALQDFCLGKNDLALMHKLALAGSDHRKFLRQIMVSVDITAPRYWWAEFDTYKVGTVANSCSTMHTIHKKEFELDDFSFDGLLSPFDLRDAINRLNTYRELYLQTKEKIYWRSMIILLPQSYNQKRTVTLNYEVLLNQYHARKQHKLDEWHIYCDWIESLPYFKEICL
jgi:hypothetical protein